MPRRRVVRPRRLRRSPSESPRIAPAIAGAFLCYHCLMGKWIHRIVEGVCVNCGPDVKVVTRKIRGVEREVCFNSSNVQSGRYGDTKSRPGRPSYRRAKRIEELGYEHTGVCESCGDPCTPVTDHSHKTGAARGYLCTPCNLAAGHLKDDPTRARMIAEYLERHA